jgi:hypothetical protein
MATTDSMTGTSISTPTTVASAAPDSKPNSAMAAATASSKKLLAPISAEGPATQCASPSRAVEQIGQPGVEIDLNQDRNRQQRDDQRLGDDLLALEAEQQHQGRQQRDERDRAEPVEQPPPAPATARLISAATQRPAPRSPARRCRAHRQEQRVPRHVMADSRAAADDGARRRHHDGVVERHLLKVKCGSPLVRLLQTNTIAVQGAAASRISRRCRLSI